MKRPVVLVVLAVFALAIMGEFALSEFLVYAARGSMPLYLYLISYGVMLVPFVIVVLAVAWAVDLRRRGLRKSLWLLMVALLVASSWVYLQGWGKARVSDLGLRAMIESRVGIGELQSWAIGLIKSEAPRLNEGQAALLIRRGDPDYAQRVPRAIRALHPLRIYVMRLQGQTYVQVELGGGWHHYGVEVGLPTFESVSSGHRFRWRPGVYGYQRRD